jgi:cephalosporin hydroxylase
MLKKGKKGEIMFDEARRQQMTERLDKWLQGNVREKIHEYAPFSVLGWFDDKQKAWYQREVGQIQNGIVVEIGVYGGASLLSIADICKDNHNTLFGVDPWELVKTSNGIDITGERLIQTKDKMKKIRLNLEKTIAGLGHNHITLKKGFSIDVACEFTDKSLDFVFIDGDHSYDSAWSDIRAWYPKVKIGHTLAGHDFGDPEVSRAVTNFANDKNLKFSTSCGNWIIVK